MVDRICDNCMSRVPADSEKCPRCGIRFENTNPGGALPNGWVLGGRYTVGRYMEIDGEGVTYSAIDGNTLQRVIVKEYMPVTLCATRDETGSIVPKPGNEVLFKTTRMDFRELYDTLLRLGLTEGLSQVLDVLEENNTAYAIIEQIEGPTLTEFLTRSGEPMEPARAMAVLRPILMGVEAMHSANLVHRGISPDNIILESGGTAKLGGFGTLALRQQGSELKPKLYPGYSAPEQYAANEFEGRYTDIYALGAVLYRMLTAESPDPADERKMQDNLRQARQLNKEVPNYVSAAIGRALRMAPAERLQTISDFRLALSGEGGSKVSSGKKSGGGKGFTRQQMIIGGVALGAVVVLLVIILLINVLGGGSDEDATSLSTSLTSESSSELNPADNQVPDFVGRTRAYVEENYRDYSFRWEEAFSEAQNEGVVMSQDPPANTEYNGGTITLTVSKGKDPTASLAEMPDFTSNRTTLSAALATLTSMEIPNENITQVTEENDGTYEEGQIVRTTPTARTSFNIDSDKITLYVAGPKPTTMPNLAGMTWDQATAELDKQGISYSGPEWQVNNEGLYKPDTVARTSIEAGGNVQSGTRVTIYMASAVSLPNVVGMSLNEAEAKIKAVEKSGVTVTIITQAVESNAPVGEVITMDPASGVEFSGSFTVTLTYSAPPEDAG